MDWLPTKTNSLSPVICLDARRMCSRSALFNGFVAAEYLGAFVLWHQNGEGTILPKPVAFLGAIAKHLEDRIDSPQGDAPPFAQAVLQRLAVVRIGEAALHLLHDEGEFRRIFPQDAGDHAIHFETALVDEPVRVHAAAKISPFRHRFIQIQDGSGDHGPSGEVGGGAGFGGDLGGIELGGGEAPALAVKIRDEVGDFAGFRLADEEAAEEGGGDGFR